MVLDRNWTSVYPFSQTEAGFLEQRGHLSLSEYGSTDLQGDGGEGLGWGPMDSLSGSYVSRDASLSAKGVNVGKQVCRATLWVGGVGVSDRAKDLIGDRKAAELGWSQWTILLK